MKFNALDFISCPECKYFPLKLHELVLKDASDSSGRYYSCEQYCGYVEQAIADAKPDTLDCEQCYSKTIEGGVLSCTDCGSLYQIKNGIPRLILDDLKSEQEIQFLERFKFLVGARQNVLDNRAINSSVLKAKRAEISARGKYEKDEILGILTAKRHQLMKEIEIKAVFRFLDLKNDDIILDAGAGEGDFSIPLSRKCCYVVSTDITFEVLLALKEFAYGISTPYRDGYEEFPEVKICLIQADNCHLPFREGFRFNKVISTQVVSHIPGEKERENSIKEVWKYLQPNGVFVLTVANWDIIRRLARFRNGTPKEATLEGARGVGYYYKFSAPELRALLKNGGFTVKKLSGVHNPAFRQPGVNEGIARFLEMGVSKFPFASRQIGNLLLAKCRKIIS